MRKILTTLAVALLAMSAPAQAEWRTFVAHGHVTVATPTAPAGAKVTIRFSYDDDAQPDISSGEGKGPGYSTATFRFSTKLKMRVNGHVMTAVSTRVDIVNNFGGNVEDSISVYSNSPMVLDGTTFPEGTFGFYLGSAPNKTKALKSTALPRKIEVKKFNAPGFQYGFAQVDGSSNGSLLNIVIDSVNEVNSNKDADD